MRLIEIHAVVVDTSKFASIQFLTTSKFTFESCNEIHPQIMSHCSSVSLDLTPEFLFFENIGSPLLIALTSSSKVLRDIE